MVYGPELTEKAADLAGTIVYELLCDVNPRFPGSICRRRARAQPPLGGMTRMGWSGRLSACGRKARRENFSDPSDV